MLIKIIVDGTAGNHYIKYCQTQKEADAFLKVTGKFIKTAQVYVNGEFSRTVKGGK